MLKILFPSKPVMAFATANNKTARAIYAK